MWPSFDPSVKEDVNDWQYTSLLASPGYRWTTDSEDVSAEVVLTHRAVWAVAKANALANTVI